MTNDKKKKNDMSMLDGICCTSAFTAVGITTIYDNDDYVIVVHIYNDCQVGRKSRCKIHYDSRYYPYILTGRQKYFLNQFERTILLF